MDKRSRIKDSSKKKRKRSGKKSGFEKDKRNSIRVSVDLFTVAPGASPLILDGFTSSDTVGVVKARVCERAKDLGFRPLWPETASLCLPGAHALEDNETLASLLPPGCSHLPREPIEMYYLEGVVMEESDDSHNKEHDNWLSLCRFVRFEKEAHEGILVTYTTEEDDNKRYPVSIVKRPKAVHAPLPLFAESEDVHVLIHGDYELLGYGNGYPFAEDVLLLDYNNISSSSVSAFSLVSSNRELKTTASVILLAPSDEIFKDLVSLNSDSQYLVVRVYWDGFSYILLRKVRESYPDIPIVAVTDLDPHHLDLLTFLDTSHNDLHMCYGWDFTFDFEEFNSHFDIDLVNIKWLGLRDVDCKDLPFDGVSCPPPPGFQEVISMLRVNPFLRRKRKWLAALDWLDMFGRSMALASAYLGNDFIAKKLSDKDWV